MGNFSLRLSNCKAVNLYKYDHMISEKPSSFLLHVAKFYVTLFCTCARTLSACDRISTSDIFLLET
jgi:hypothetical protein